MNNSTNQANVFENNFVGTQPEGNGNQPLYNNQMQGLQQVPPNQVYQNSVYQNPNVAQSMRVPSIPTQGQMGINGNQGIQSFNYPNQPYIQGGQNGIIYPQGGIPVSQVDQQGVFNQPSFVETNIQESYVPPVNQNPSFVVQPEPIIERQEEMVKPTDSYTEMAFAGVNQQEEDPKQVTVLTSGTKPVNSVSPVEVSTTENMQPVEKRADENAGLKFLGIIFFILIVVIFCLPLIGLN